MTQTILYLVLLIIVMITIMIKTRKSLHMMQQNLYNENNRYLKWVGHNLIDFLNLEIIAIVLAVVAYLNHMDENFAIMNIVICFVLTIYLLVDKSKREQVKKPLVITKRVRRIIFTLTILHLIPIIFLIRLEESMQLLWLVIIIYIVMSYLNRLVVLLAVIINHPYERGVYYYYLGKAKRKLRNMPGLKVVGITGSYGKTSSKNILADILNIKYNTLPSPKNLNTPYGLMITINNHMDKFTDVFIAEMGAYVKGEVKELCDFVKPKYGILTKIGTAHLESFGSEANIQEGKFELIESLPSDGVGILNKDDPKQVDYKLKNKVKILWIGIDSDDVDVRAVDIKCDNKGTSFKVLFKGDKKKYEFQTKLLGEHNVYNILAGIALGNYLGIEISSLQKAVKTVKTIEHRLELKPLGNFYMIDDAYNSNPVGAKNAVEVLGMMPGLKVVVTPGMIELGSKEEHYNNEFGKQIAKVADYVVLIGKNRTKPIYEGLIEQDFDKDKIIIYNDVKEAYNYINGLVTGKKDVYALFENDLPDTYNE